MTYAQSGEDLEILRLSTHIGIDSGTFLECGAGNGRDLSNTRLLADRGWSGLWIEADPRYFGALLRNSAACGGRVKVSNSRVTVEEGFDEAIDRAGIPDPDVVSIDIDGNDYWVWQALQRKPAIVCIEYNAGFPPETRKTIEYDPDFEFGNTNYHGATAGALYDLGKQKGYRMVANVGVNLLFVRGDLAGDLPEFELAQVRQGRGWRKDPERKMIDV